MNTFDKVSDQYKEKSLVQQKAALKLFDLLEVGSNDDIIDVACGPGHITNWLSKATRGKIIGIDISEGMIKQAKALYPKIEFTQLSPLVMTTAKNIYNFFLLFSHRTRSF